MTLYLAGFSQTPARTRGFDWDIPFEALGAVKQYRDDPDTFVFLKEEFRREPWLPDGETLGSWVLGSLEDIRAKNRALFTELLECPAQVFEFTAREGTSLSDYRKARMIVPAKAVSEISEDTDSLGCYIHIHPRWRRSVGLEGETGFTAVGTLDRLILSNQTFAFPLRPDQAMHRRASRASHPVIA